MPAGETPGLPTEPDGMSGAGHGRGAGGGRAVPRTDTSDAGETERARREAPGVEAGSGPVPAHPAGWGPAPGEPARDVYGNPVREGASSGTLERISTCSMRSPAKTRQAAASASVS